MAMGGFQRNRGYNQENAMSGMGALSKLLGQQSDSFQKVGDTVEAQGQSNARGKIADLMGTDEYKDSNPEEAQALVQALTGGRQLGDRGTEMLKQTYGAKQKVLDNENNVTAAALLESGRNARNATNEAGRNARSKARDLVLGKTEGVGGMGDELVKIKEQALRIQKDLDNPNLSEEIKAERKAEQELLQIKSEQIVSNNKPSAGGEANIMQNLFPGTNTAGSVKETKPQATPKAFNSVTQNMSKTEKGLFNEAWNSDLLKALPREYYQKTDPKVKSGHKKVGDAKYSEDAQIMYTDPKTGQSGWVRATRPEIMRYLKAQKK